MVWGLPEGVGATGWRGQRKKFWDNFKKSNIHNIGVPEGEEKEQEIGNLFEKNNERKLP